MRKWEGTISTLSWRACRPFPSAGRKHFRALTFIKPSSSSGHFFVCGSDVVGANWLGALVWMASVSFMGGLLAQHPIIAENGRGQRTPGPAPAGERGLLSIEILPYWLRCCNAESTTYALNAAETYGIGTGGGRRTLQGASIAAVIPIDAAYTAGSENCSSGLRVFKAVEIGQTAWKLKPRGEVDCVYETALKQKLTFF